MKTVSVYVKGDRNSTAYYRIYQYLDHIRNVGYRYNIMYPLWVQRNFMPVTKQNKLLQIIIYLVSLIKMINCLIYDAFKKPDIIIVHKRIISRYMPYVCQLLILFCHKRGCKIIWDFDDHIVKGKEMTQSTFDFFVKLCDTIIVTHEYLRSLIPNIYQDKVIIMPTTDGDMYKIFNKNNLTEERLQSFDKEIRMVWVATSSNLKNLLPVLPFLDEAAQKLKEKNKNLILKVICDKPVNYDSTSLIIENIKWKRDVAIQGMRESHIGIMPLSNTIYNKGKGGFKLVQYISIGLPCIGSNVGFNEHVISSECGFLVDNSNDWINAIIDLSDKRKWCKCSELAYHHWCNEFSYDKNLEIWSSLIYSHSN